ncbi:MAG: hypothetical protein Kow0098_08750 [Ignavibacteriaceae bacterium]
MVQGHTVDVLLANEFRNVEYTAYSIWFFMRGMTAPIFMFTAGTVFVYLFRLVNKPFFENPRVWKGVKRFLLLVLLGYLLRYPTPTLIDFSKVSEESLRIFYSVDVLHLIGFSLLFLLILSFIAEKIKLGDYLIFSIASAFFFLFHLYSKNYNWTEIFPVPVAAYFNKSTGSLFPLFPWAGYVIAGGVLGSYLAKHPLVFRSFKLSFYLAVYGIIFLTVSFLLKMFSPENSVPEIIPASELSIIFLRTGFVLILNSLVSFISLKIKSIPKILILIGRNTLLIYVVHLMILYGSVWNPGLNKFFYQSLDTGTTIFIAITMIVLMTVMVIIVNKFKIRNKQLVT